MLFDRKAMPVWRARPTCRKITLARVECTEEAGSRIYGSTKSRASFSPSKVTVLKRFFIRLDNEKCYSSLITESRWLNLGSVCLRLRVY